MNFSNSVKLYLLSTFLLTSCNLGAANTPTIIPEAAPTQAEATSAPVADAENMYSFDAMNIAVGFNYPEGYPQGTIVELAPQSEEASAPYEPLYPQHARIVFIASADTVISAETTGIRVFRTDEINAVVPEVISSLNAVLAGQLEQRTDFPRLPGAGRLIDAQAVLLPFQNGNGYRFLSFSKFDASALGGTSMTYLYQGLTEDGQYIVSFITRVDAPFLADLATGQAFATAEEASAYKTLVNDRLNSADASQFNPPLTTLDELAASIIVNQK